MAKKNYVIRAEMKNKDVTVTVNFAVDAASIKQAMREVDRYFGDIQEKEEE